MPGATRRYGTRTYETPSPRVSRTVSSWAQKTGPGGPPSGTGRTPNGSGGPPACGGGESVAELAPGRPGGDCVSRPAWGGEVNNGGDTMTQTQQEPPALAGLVPDGFEVIRRWVQHPVRDAMVGMLIRNRRTGAYAHCLGGVLRSVPRDWACAMAAQAPAGE